MSRRKIIKGIRRRSKEHLLNKEEIKRRAKGGKKEERMKKILM